MIERVLARLRSLFMRGRLERDMLEEMRTHLERATDRYVENGLTPRAARAAAEREFGNVGLLQEQARDARGLRWIESIVGDVRFAGRHFARMPFSTVVLVLILAFGLGVTSSLFTLIHSLETAPPEGVADNASLVRIRGTIQQQESGYPFERPLNAEELSVYRARHDVFEDVASFEESDVQLHPTEGVSLPAALARVSGNYFALLGIRASAGRLIDAGDIGDRDRSASASSTSAVAVISDRVWREQYGQSRSAIGSTLHIGDATAIIIGVAPRNFRGVGQGNDGNAVWMPLVDDRPNAQLRAVARLQPGVALERADAAISSMAATFVARSDKRGNPDRVGSDVVPLLGGNVMPSFGSERALYSSLAGICLLILAIICTTISALLVGSGVTRRGEIAVRLSLGAPRTRIIRQLLTESVVMSVTGGLLGLLVFVLILPLMGGRTGSVVISPDWSSVAFTIGIAVIVGIACGLSPALHATRLGVSEVLKDATAGVAVSRLGLQRRLVVLQVALTQPMLVALGALAVFTFQDSRTTASSPVGDHIAVAYFQPARGANVTSAQIEESIDQTAAAIAALPDVAAVVAHKGGYLQAQMTVDPRDANGTPAHFMSHGHFRAPGALALLGTPVIAGRDFQSGDDKVVIIGSDLAEELWHGANPIGRRFHRSRNGSEDPADVTVIGVVDSKAAGRSEEGAGKRVYVPIGATSTSAIVMVMNGATTDALLVRTRGLARDAFIPIRHAAQAEENRVPMLQVSSLADIDAKNRADRIRLSKMGAGGGLLALLLASVGLYAVVALSVKQRLREIGIRLALGAQAAQVVFLFFRTGLRLCVIGLALGLPFSILALHTVGAEIRMPKGMLGALLSAGVLLVASIASWVPARRAASVDPLLSIRAQ